MSDVREQRIYCAEQIYVPENLPTIIKHYSKEVIKNNPEDIIHFSMKYFEKLLRQRDTEPDKTNFSEIKKPDSNQIPGSSEVVQDPEIQSKIESTVKGAFDAVDENGTGFISISELENAIRQLGFVGTTDEVKAFLANFDFDDDKRLNYDEFMRMVQDLGLMDMIRDSVTG